MVRSAGDECPVGQRSFLQGKSAQHGEFWSVACNNGRSYMVQIQPSGQTKVLECGVAAAVGTPCFKKF